MRSGCCLVLVLVLVLVVVVVVVAQMQDHFVPSGKRSERNTFISSSFCSERMSFSNQGFPGFQCPGRVAQNPRIPRCVVLLPYLSITAVTYPCHLNSFEFVSAMACVTSFPFFFLLDSCDCTLSSTVSQSHTLR